MGPHDLQDVMASLNVRGFARAKMVRVDRVARINAGMDTLTVPSAPTAVVPADTPASAASQPQADCVFKNVILCRKVFDQACMAEVTHAPPEILQAMRDRWLSVHGSAPSEERALTYVQLSVLYRLGEPGYNMIAFDMAIF